MIDQKHEPDGMNPEHIDLNNVDNLDEEDDIEEEVDEQFFRMNVTDATAKTAMLQAAVKRARTNADKHREARARRAELRSLQNGEDVQVGDFKTGVNRGANLLRQAMNALHRGVGTDDVSGILSGRDVFGCAEA